MARQGLAALTGGVKEGYEFVDERRREKQIRELLGQETARLKRRGQAEGKDVERLYPGEFNFEQYEMPQTFGQKLMGGVKNFFRPEQQTQALALQPPPAAAPGQIPDYAIEPERFVDGGSVRHMRKKYANGGRSLGPHQGGPGRVGFMPYKNGGGVNTGGYSVPLPLAHGGEVEEDGFGEDLKRNALELVKSGFANTIEEALEMSQEAGSRQAEVFAPGKTAAERGQSARGAIGETVGGLIKTAGGLAKDIVRPLEPVARFIGGAAGYGTGGELEGRQDTGDAIRALPMDQPPEQAAAGIAAQPDSGAGEGAPVSAGGGQALQAIPSTQGPKDREIDFSTEAREVMPEDLPSHSSKDWEDERNYWAASAIMKGEDPFEAMKNVDQQQLNGFSRYAMQATALMDAGDLEGASRSLYAAYQYFPNGKDVKFGVQTGKDGNRVVVAMGKDEKSGDPSGPPQILNRDVISRMVENMKQPGALRAWTTDWQTTEAKLWEQGYKEDVLKETGRASRARERGFEARTAVMGAGGDGIKQSDLDRAFSEFMGSQELRQLEDPAVAEDLADIMTRLYQRTGGGREGAGSPSIIAAVLAAHRDGSLDELRKQYGLQ